MIKNNKKYIFLLVFGLPILLLLILFSIFQINSKSYISEDLKERELKGYVKDILKSGNSIYENSIMHYDTKGNLKVSADVSLSMTNISYDPTSKAKQTAIYNITLHIKTKDTIADIKKVYSRNQSLINLMRKKYEKQIGLTLENKQQYYFQDKVNIEVKKTNNKNEKIKEYKINANGEIIFNQYVRYSNDSIYIFDQRNNSIHQIKYMINEDNYKIITYNNDLLSNKYIELYENGEIIRKDIFDKNNVKWSFTNYIYNNKGILSKKVIYADESKSEYEQSLLSAIFGKRKKRSSVIFEYVLDDFGNWTKKSINKNSERQTINRKIIYYNFWDFFKGKLNI